MRPFKMVIFILPLSTAFPPLCQSGWALEHSWKTEELLQIWTSFRFCFECGERPWMTWLVLFRSGNAGKYSFGEILKKMSSLLCFQGFLSNSNHNPLPKPLTKYLFKGFFVQLYGRRAAVIALIFIVLILPKVVELLLSWDLVVLVGVIRPANKCKVMQTYFYLMQF